MYGDEEISFLPRGELGPVDEGDEDVVLLARQVDVHPGIELFYLVFQELGYLQRELLLLRLLVLADGSRVLASVPGVDDDCTEPELLRGGLRTGREEARGKDCGTEYAGFHFISRLW